MPDVDTPAIRARYEATPRRIDDDLEPLARGDRGCLGDLMAGLGALGTAVFGIIAATGAGGWGFMAISAAVFVLGFLLSTIHQLRSARVRRLALERGPLVLARVVRVEPRLREAGAGVGLARVVFSLAPDRRFDADALAAIGGRVRALEAGEETDAGAEAARAALARRSIAGVQPLAEALVACPEVHVAEVILDKERRGGQALAEGDLVALLVEPASGVVEHVA